MQVLRRAPGAALANLEVLGLQVAYRVAVAVDNEDLELHELHIDLAAVLGTLEEFGVLHLPAVGELRRDADEVAGRDALDQRVDGDRACLTAMRGWVEVVERRNRMVAAIERNAFEGRGTRHGDAGCDAECRRARPAYRSNLCNADSESRVETVENDAVGAGEPSRVGVGPDLQRLWAGRVVEPDAGHIRRFPGFLRPHAVEEEVDRLDRRIDDQGLDLDRTGE